MWQKRDLLFMYEAFGIWILTSILVVSRDLVSSAFIFFAEVLTN
jgi:hypothetical protein